MSLFDFIDVPYVLIYFPSDLFVYPFFRNTIYSLERFCNQPPNQLHQRNKQENFNFNLFVEVLSHLLICVHYERCKL